MFDTLKKVLAPIGPSGMEGPVAAVIREELQGYVDGFATDAMGNLICVKQGKGENPRRIMLSAHMDHIGFVVTGIEKEGFLRVTNVGGVGLNTTLTRHVVFPNGVHGVVVSEPVEGARTMKHMFIDIGAQDKEDALKMGEIFLKMIQGEASEDEIDSLEEASALRDIAHMPARVKCAVLGWRTLKEALLDGDELS